MNAAIPSEALILTKADIASLMSPGDWLNAVETGFRAKATGDAHSPAPMTIEGTGGTFHAKGATIGLDRQYVALKFNGNFPDNRQSRALPTIQGALLLCDGETGSLLAVMDSIEVTLRRTAAATGLAARHLARSASSSILICGAGEQGGAHLAALRSLFQLKRVVAWDGDFGRARAFADRFSSAELEVGAVRDLPGSDRAFDIIVTATPAREPFLDSTLVLPGTFVAAVGADSPHKNELHPDIFRAACVVTDVLSQCAELGDLKHALDAGTIDFSDVHADLSELVVGAKPGRTSDGQVTIFDSTGTAVEDVAAAALIYERAVLQTGIRTVALAG